MPVHASLSLPADEFRKEINRFPCYAGSGGRVASISDDWHRWRIELPFDDKTRNLVGSTFGGSLYACIDPILMLAFMKILGPRYIVWDKGATIRFRRPGRGLLVADIEVDPAEVETVRRLCREKTKFDRTHQVLLKDEAGVVHAEVDKVIHFRAAANAGTAAYD